MTSGSGGHGIVATGCIRRQGWLVRSRDDFQLAVRVRDVSASHASAAQMVYHESRLEFSLGPNRRHRPCRVPVAHRARLHNITSTPPTCGPADSAVSAGSRTKGRGARPPGAVIMVTHWWTSLRRTLKECQLYDYSTQQWRRFSERSCQGRRQASLPPINKATSSWPYSTDCASEA